MNTPYTARVGIVGGGFGALVTYAILRFRGLTSSDILVFSTDTSPEKSWERLAQSIQMRWLRSESVGHFYPTDSPGLATMEAIRTWSPMPIIKSWFNQYHPSVASFLTHTRAITRQVGFQQSLLNVTVTDIERLNDEFAIYDENHTHVATVQHLVLAVGHGQVNIPEPVQAFRNQYPTDNRVALPFETKEYTPHTVLVLGDGITAGNEWVNVLKAGGAVAALSQRGFAFGQPLQVPRRYFSRRGLRPFQQMSGAARLTELQAITRGTMPTYGSWEKLFDTSHKRGRLGLAQGTLTAIHPQGNKLACVIDFTNGKQDTVLVDRVITATGFKPATTHPLLSRLIDRYNLPTMNGVLVIDNNCCIEELSTPTSMCGVVGHASAWAIPCADSLGGMKIIARRLAHIILGPEDTSLRMFWQQLTRWHQLVSGKELV